MGIPQYLAMTGLELYKNHLPEHTAYMSCHFSSYNSGLSNLPASLPPGCLVLVDDATAPAGHDPALAARQLGGLVERQGCMGVLLDFQRPGTREAEAMAGHLVKELPCPVAVTGAYAQGLDCPVCLPPVPPHITLKDYYDPWQGRCIWQELALGGVCLTLSQEGCRAAPLSEPPQDRPVFRDEELSCHYCMEVRQEEVRFCLWRTGEDLAALAGAMEEWGVALTVGLWQELGCGKIEN